MYVIFYNNTPVYLTQNTSNCQNSETFDMGKTTVFELLAKIDTGTLKSVCYLHKDIDYLYKAFVSQFKIIEAAGGLVFNQTKELLFIYRNDMWDLPKGKIEKRESVSEAALREVEEECGIRHLQLDCFLDKTYHIYEFNNRFIFKITHWFIMKSNQITPLKPQIEEGITKAVFLDKNAQKEALKNTYPNIKLLLKNLDL
jgi:8-oxo-dGTP pyrophosphatase MutT (NUDIX family)